MRAALFWWLVLSILITSAAVGATFAVFGDDSWNHVATRVERFAGGLWADAWDDPVARERLATAMEVDLGTSVEVRDLGGTVLHAATRDCEGADQLIQVPRRGTVRVCMPRPSHGGVHLGALGVALIVLFSLSGLLARKLARPVRAVARVAERLAEGDLSARVGPRRDLRAEMGVLARTIDAMAERVEAQLRDQRELLATVSHELRTPLGHMRILVELARDGDLDERALEEFERELGEMDEMVGELLARSRLDFGNLQLSRVPLSDLAARALERQGLPAALLDSTTPGVAAVEATLVAQALANLLRNAERHGGGVTSLRVRAEADEVLLAVEDEGPGFDWPPAADSGRPAASPLRLGLALSQKIAEVHGGSLAVSRRQRGACVELRFPTPISEDGEISDADDTMGSQP